VLWLIMVTAQTLNTSIHFSHHFSWSVPLNILLLLQQC